MPPTPEPDEDDSDAITPPPPVFHAEQALLGALLLDPRLLHDVTGISNNSFSTAEHAALFAAISTLPAPDPVEHTKNTRWLDHVLATARQQAHGLNAPYLHALVQACPWPPHAPAYARMVEANRARHRLRTAAAHLAQTAHDTSLPHPVQSALAEVDSLTTVVDETAARFPPRAGVLPRTPAPPSDAVPDVAEAVQEEQLLLATATAQPADAEQVRWLLAEDFTQPLHAGLWQCLTTLARRHEPVDPVTVLWEAQLRDLLHDGHNPGEILHMLAEPAGSVEHWGRQILQRALLATTTHKGRHIEAYANDPANTPFQLVVGARRALADINAIRTRWHTATSPQPQPPPPSRPAPGIRTGPPTTTGHPARAAR